MLETMLKLTQVLFYVTVGTVAVLTYLKAKKTLLNSVNTEYNKHIINRLADLADELFSEFERENPNFWANHSLIDEHFEAFSREYEEYKKRYPKKEPEIDYFAGTPVSKMNLSLISFERKVRTDPFIPQKIRTEVLDYLVGRMEVLSGAEKLSKDKVFQLQLSQDRPLEKSDTLHGISNTVNDYLYKHGFGISQCEEKVEAIRLLIQTHFESYDPLA